MSTCPTAALEIILDITSLYLQVKRTAIFGACPTSWPPNKAPSDLK